MTFKLNIPGRDELGSTSVANTAFLLTSAKSNSKLARLAPREPSNPQPIDESISGLAGLADIAASIAARQLAADLIHAAMKVCDMHGDDDVARQDMREQCLALPLHLQADLLEHFKGVKHDRSE